MDNLRKQSQLIFAKGELESIFLDANILHEVYLKKK